MLDTMRYGGLPPVTVSEAGVFEFTIATAGKMVTGPGVVGGGAKGLFGAPLPPPQPPSNANPASVNNARIGRSQRAVEQIGTMTPSLMMLS